MGEVVVLPVVRVERCEGNGAREALIEIGKNCPFHILEDVATCWADDVLLELGARGFKVVPLCDEGAGS